jgi:23S rRNA pseudouridine1911/1915/1917 synthase
MSSPFLAFFATRRPGETFRFRTRKVSGGRRDILVLCRWPRIPFRIRNPEGVSGRDVNRLGGSADNSRLGFMSSELFSVKPEQAGTTLAAFLRPYFPGWSWNQIRRLIAQRHVRIGGEICLDPARRLRPDETVELLDRATPKPPAQEVVKLRYLDDHLVVVEKPAGIATVRHPLERHWSQKRKSLYATLEDVVPRLVIRREGKRKKGIAPRLRVVHRLDKETSGLVVFARTPAAERLLGKQFHDHRVIRQYLAIIPGKIVPQRIATRLVRDRGDGRRGSTTVSGLGKEAVTHLEVVERCAGYTLLRCRLETGRTHQIRIHLAELGHPICGEKVYNRSPRGKVIEDTSGAPRLALHAAELGFVHPVSGDAMHWEMELPMDLKDFFQGLRSQSHDYPNGSSGSGFRS